MPAVPPLTKGLMVDQTPEAAGLGFFSSPIAVKKKGFQRRRRKGRTSKKCESGAHTAEWLGMERVQERESTLLSRANIYILQFAKFLVRIFPHQTREQRFDKISVVFLSFFFLDLLIRY